MNYKVGDRVRCVGRDSKGDDDLGTIVEIDSSEFAPINVWWDLDRDTGWVNVEDIKLHEKDRTLHPGDRVRYGNSSDGSLVRKEKYVTGATLWLVDWDHGEMSFVNEDDVRLIEG